MDGPISVNSTSGVRVPDFFNATLKNLVFATTTLHQIHHGVAKKLHHAKSVVLSNCMSS